MSEPATPNVAVLSGMRNETNGKRLEVCKPDPERNGMSPLCMASTPDLLAVYKYELTDDPVTCDRCLATD